ncbi:LacI family DNA-binding transcriptional regulator [Paenibacillus sp. IB182496]|uniref:LacI family DNA-binding transcriptional regulator n=1 Tax=Paenibacillus sabuli TaxID=2772509 RepID=A0A927BYA1_9BACL|nr:LacI family DNA-binding transcriptional regulator [Paenibacillus sabuli]MBD2847714.1 LacI family DNA-binding transcriptional regulator [Paenibacillus sabuli]
MKKTVTIHDIARIAEVSSATVSRVLSNSSYPVSDKLRSKILRIAKEHNYIPNLIGKQLKTNASMTIGVIIPTITNPFYSSVILGIEEIARQNHYHVIVCNSLHNPEFEGEYIKTMVEKQIKGLIISSISKDVSLLKQFMRAGLNVIAIDQKIDEDEITQIEFNYEKGGYMAAQHLLALGHTRIGYATSRLDRPSRRDIHAGYLRAMEEAGLPALVEESQSEEAFNSTGEFDVGKRLAARMLAASTPPTAIFACNDMMAFGVINELMLRGISVPGEISVIGFDGIEFGKMTHPPLTTIKQPDYEMGILSGKILLDMMRGDENPTLSVTLQPKLVERASAAQAHTSSPI